MDNNVNNTLSLHDILPIIAKYIDRYEINVSELTNKEGINRKTFYNKLYSDSKDLEFIEKVCRSLGIEITVKLASSK